MDFAQKLLQASTRNKSLLCLGLDPDPELMPEAGVIEFNRAIIDATADLVCAYKPNLAFYEALGSAGLAALQETVKHIPEGIPVIGDAKRGDVGHTARAYARALFEVLGFDAVTVSPYLGHDSIEPFTRYADRAVFVLCRTSNPGAGDFQDALCSDAQGSDGQPLYRLVASRAQEWNTRGNVGLVVGATYPRELSEIRQLCPQMDLLIPGIGAQGGDLEWAVRHGTDGQGRRAIFASSRQILYASRGSDYARAARESADGLRRQINSFL
ncbi:MAG: orotidine-5'-phosphate decarboxylase [Chloroflexi bacterium]|nr:orotidine-5'-phosphate decarboxylase [Chloroflexota bacterium]